jgi:hypothetical protein
MNSILVPNALRSVSRGQIFFCVFFAAFCNGIAERAVRAVINEGWANALGSTFNISVLVWVACCVGSTLLLSSSAEPAGRMDWAVAGGAGSLLLVPISDLSWIALAGVALYAIRTSPARSPIRRASWIFFAITAPMFWSPRLFSIVSEWILVIDAALVSAILGTERIGNVVSLAGDDSLMYIAPECSSISNVSLALLCWVLCTQSLPSRRRGNGVMPCLLACAAVILLNVARMSLIGRFPQHYDLLHGPVGASAASWLALLAMAGICLWGVTRDPVRP